MKIEWFDANETYGRPTKRSSALTKKLWETFPGADPERIRVMRVGDEIEYRYKGKAF